MKNGNLREEAILALLREGKKQGENAVILNATLRGLGDNQLFALHIEVFGHAVGEKPAGGGHTEPESACWLCNQAAVRS